MKSQFTATLALVFAAACTSDSQVRAALKKNPEILFEAIEANPEKFMEAVNKAARKAQAGERERQMAEMRAEQERDLKNPKQPKLSPDRRLSGTDDGKIVVVEYADFQCPACAMAHRSLKDFIAKRPGQVQFYYKHMPLNFHPMAMPAALHFEAIRLQDKAKAAKFYDLVFENQRSLSEVSLKKAAQQAGADMKKLAADVQSEKVREIVAEDMKEFEGFGFTGTPVVLVNGVAMQGAQPIEALERMAELTAKR
jgi:protein-disulfide isomerase